MNQKVALVRLEEDVGKSLKKALKLIGGIDDLNKKEREVTIKVGIFNHKTPHHTSANVLNAIAKGFNEAPHIHVAESDNYRGKALERLQVYGELFSRRVTPFSLSNDSETREVEITGERLNFSHVLFKPNVFVSTHVLRYADFLDASWGSIVKNLLGLVPDHKKVRFHKKLPQTLLDCYEAIGGIDLAVLDGTYAHVDFTGKKNLKCDLLAVGRDAIAVDAVGAHLLGIDFKRMSVLKEAKKRNIGTWDVNEIKVVGESLEEEALRIEELMKRKSPGAKKKKAATKSKA